MKKRYEKTWNIIISGMFLICVISWLLDFVYHDYLYCDFLWNAASLIEGWLTKIGFEEQRALGVLDSSLGLVITMITFGLTMGVNLFNRYERKIYGISCGELYGFHSFMRKISYRISWGIPVFIVIAINLKLCATCYLLLFYSYIMVFYNYGNFGRSYDKESMRRDVVDLLIARGECGDVLNGQLMDYDATIDDIRQGIWEVEGWSNAWLLLNDFIDSIVNYEEEKLYLLSCHFWDIFFTREIAWKSLTFIQKFLKQMGESDDKYEKRLIVFWSLLCSVALKWKSETLKSFLEWFTDLTNRGGQRVLMKEAGMVLLMLEYWLYIDNEKVNIRLEYAEKLYEYGRKLFLDEDFIDYLACLYQKQYEIENWEPCTAAQIFCMDIKYNLKNSLFRSEFNI